MENGQVDPSLSASTEQPENNQTEKLLTQSEVNELVGAVKKQAYEKGKQHGAAEIQKMMPQQNNASSQTMGGMPQLSKEELQKQIADETARQLQQQANALAGQQAANQFFQKLHTGAAKYPDFEEAVKDLDWSKIAPVVHLANGMDNTADIVYDLGKNPHKIANLMGLAQYQPNLAYREMQKLSHSIKQNESAKNAPDETEPLSHLKPSTAGTDNGKMTLRDYKKADWLRG